MKKLTVLITSLLCATCHIAAQDFFNLTAREVKVDSVLPYFTHTFQLGTDYADSTYSVSIDYPEFIDMQADDISRYQQLSDYALLPSMPQVELNVGVDRRRGVLDVSFMPLVFRDGRFQKLVSFKLTRHSSPRRQSGPARTRAAGTTERYTSHSVLATSQWAKISVPETGVYQLTDALVRKAGFSSLSRVKIYGYGGALQPEVLTADYLAATDDLSEVPTCMVNGRRLFHAVGPVGWADATSMERTRNPYADYGCYFITESDDEPLTVDSAAFIASFYPTTNDYHTLYEVDDYSWYHSGRNLFDSQPLTTARTYELQAHDTTGRMAVAISYDANCQVTVTLNDSLIGTVSITDGLPKYSKASERVTTFNVNSLRKGTNTVVLHQTQGATAARLDYIALTMPTAAEAPDLAGGTFPVPDLMYRITNQDHHAETPVDMVIIIPTTQKLLAQAQRLKQMHETYDSMTVRIVPADELFNEFSSGTPDANAYRRYMKMLYDRAESEADMPRYLLLMGDAAWDNRMVTSDWRTTSPDDFLLCYESDNSFSETYSYVSDDYFCMLDDGEGGNLTNTDRADVGVGRLSARTAEEAQIMVDKIIDYRTNTHAGDWQNILCFLGDDGNNNVHMREADAAATKAVESNFTGYNIKKIYWDAYTRSVTSTGFRYSDVEQLVKQQMQNGALVIDYCGHGAPYSISHERVLIRQDFETQTSLRLPVWITASCDIMPFDTQEENIGETAMLNSHGGCVAFFGTTRTVFTGANEDMNCAFLKYLLDTDSNGRRYTMGDAVRLAKNQLRALRSESYPINKLHYSLLGDPALTLAIPTGTIVVDSINGQPATNGVVNLSAGMPVTVRGHVVDAPDFNGVVTLTVKNERQLITCKLNNTEDDGAQTPFTYYDRPTTLYSGSDSVRSGVFNITFILPRDISYSEYNGLMTLYAVDNTKTRTAHGQNGNFNVATAVDGGTDGVGPSIYCYLNSSSFTNGGAVNTTPYFYAQLTDKDGINATGSGVGHDMELVIDGLQSRTYILNDRFQYDFGNYQSGSVGYTLPELEPGEHQLQFRAWDVFNNSSVAELKFTVVRGLRPQCFSVDCTRNPATTGTTFIINHDRAGSEMNVELEVFDTSGRLLWHSAETGVSTDNTYTLDWNLTTDAGRRLQTGVYLYRVLISTDGSRKSSQAQKLIVISR